ncbi:hypothetical protein M404DRAFT_995345 [Pisolithus tinctorius Marx 270]|uniref:Uncharacterized protein n=1 Tax=Pisolithus tinctorius Marx 270 TaxID=870435 RepID=A0A0C3PQV4_PISTI|nr:hypothetical protein M404DRAFT_995345 [Pisolithus tinctorius Marx 270]
MTGLKPNIDAIVRPVSLPPLSTPFPTRSTGTMARMWRRNYAMSTLLSFGTWRVMSDKFGGGSLTGLSIIET